MICYIVFVIFFPGQFGGLFFCCFFLGGGVLPRNMSFSRKFRKSCWRSSLIMLFCISQVTLSMLEIYNEQVKYTADWLTINLECINYEFFDLQPLQITSTHSPNGHFDCTIQYTIFSTGTACQLAKNTKICGNGHKHLAIYSDIVQIISTHGLYEHIPPPV